MSKAEPGKPNFLSRRLRSRDGHLGRSGAEANRIASETGLSIHMIQSLAMGRKGFTNATKAKIKAAM